MKSKGLLSPVVLFLLSVLLSGSVTALAQSALVGQEKNILEVTKSSWASFRNFNGRQLIYFTHLESYSCGLEEVHYSLNSTTLDKEWLLQPCDPKKPHNISSKRPYITLPPGTAKWIAVQITFADGTKSEVVRITKDGILLDDGAAEKPARGELRLPPLGR